MMFGAVAGLLAQWGLIRMFEMTPRQLLRWGVGIAALGNLVVALSPGYYGAVAGYAISSLGFSFARPGFTVGSSIAVDMHEQARAAGAIAAVNGVNVVFAPLFAFLYQHFGPAPFIINTLLMGGLLAYAFRNVALKNADPEPASRDATTLASLETQRRGRRGLGLLNAAQPGECQDERKVSGSGARPTRPLPAVQRSPCPQRCGPRGRLRA